MPLIKASLLKWRRLTEGFAVGHGAHGGSMMTWRILFMLEILQSTINTAAAETNESGGPHSDPYVKIFSLSTIANKAA